MKNARRVCCCFLIIVLILANMATVQASNYMANTNAQTIYEYLKNTMGFNNAVCAGVLSNIRSESSFDPNNSYMEAGGYLSYGICQWNRGRQEALQNYCRNHGYDYTSLIGQLHYLDYELKNTETAAYNSLLNIPNTSQGAYDAAANFCAKFERPANVASVSAQRGAVARLIFEELPGNEIVVDAFRFSDVVYPKTFKINTTNGWFLSGGVVMSDAGLNSIKSDILTSSGSVLTSYGPITITGSSYGIIGLDSGVRFDKITNPGGYIWRLTATDNANRTLIMEMPFTAVNSGETATDSMSKEYPVVIEPEPELEPEPEPEPEPRPTYCWPVSTSARITAEWYYPESYGGGYHGATDFGVGIGTEVHAIADGTIITANDNGITGKVSSPSYGNWIIIDHGNDVYSVYAHLSTGSFRVSVGQRVLQGQVIALSGAAGNVTGPHLHLELRMGGNTWKVNNVDPLNYLTKIDPPDPVPSTPATTLKFSDVGYPPQFQINRTNGWFVRSGSVASNVELRTIRSLLSKDDGSWAQDTGDISISGQYYAISAIDSHIKFSDIATPGAYTWTLTATDANGRVLSLPMHINVVSSGGTSATAYIGVEYSDAYLDVNGWLNGAQSGTLGDCGTVDVYVNGDLVANDVNDYYAQHPAGAAYEIRDIQGINGYQYEGVHSGTLTGTIGSPSTQVILTFNDKASPAVSNITVSDVSPTGYTVTCSVSDNVGVSRVAFPTIASGETEFIWKDGTISGNTASFRVNTSEHGDRYGNYRTEVYAYDAAGNHNELDDSMVVSVDVPAPYVEPTQVFRLPTALTVIGEEAFVGIDARAIVLHDGVTRIENRAFADCPRLKEITIPASTTFIAKYAFDHAPSGFTIHGSMNSYAQGYAAENGFAFVADDACIVTFDANGGSCGTGSVTVKRGTAIVTLPTATLAYNAFEGWYTTPAGGDKVSGTTIINGDMTLYAHWKANGFGSWSEWSTNAVSANSNREVETEVRSVQTGTKTIYHYNRFLYKNPSYSYYWASYSSNWATNQGYSGSWQYASSETRFALDTPVDGHQVFTGEVRDGNKYWYNETTTTEPVYGNVTYYRYRDRVK